MLFVWKLLLFLVWEKECAKQSSKSCVTSWDNVSQTCQSGNWSWLQYEKAAPETAGHSLTSLWPLLCLHWHMSEIKHLHCHYFSPSLTSSALSPPLEAVLSLLAQHSCSITALLPLPGLLSSSVIQRRARRESGKHCPCHCQPNWEGPWLLPGQCPLLRVPTADPTWSSPDPARWDKPCTTEPWVQGIRWGYFYHHWINKFSSVLFYTWSSENFRDKNGYFPTLGKERVFTLLCRIYF